MIPSQATTQKLLINNVNTTAGNTTSGYLDCLGGDYASIHVALAAMATAGHSSSNGVTIKVLESTDTNVSNATAITGVSDVTGKKDGGQGCYQIPRGAGTKRYLFVRIIPGTAGVSNEAAYSTVIGSLSRKEFGPKTTSDLVSTGTNDWAVVA